MSDLKKYENEKNFCNCDKFQFLLDDYEFEVKAHAETKAKLEGLEDAIAFRTSQRVNMEMNSKNYRINYSLIFPGQGLKDEILIEAIRNSQSRANERIKTNN